MPLFFSKHFKNKEDNIKGDSVKTINYLRKLVNDRGRFEKYVFEEFSDINARQTERLEQEEWQKALENERLNRYCNILPFDKNRVKLNDRQDYVNASFIVPPCDIQPTYIAAQGPLRHTLVDFWRMIVDQAVSVIVCLTPEIEKGIEKCARYWPEGEKEWRVVMGEVTVGLKNVQKERLDSEADCIVRKISVEFYKENELVKKAEVVQLQFLGWPDHGVPNQPDKVLQLIRLARTFYKDKRPAVVHCSAGCGRTGTFCVIDSAERLIREQLGPLDPVLFLTEAFRKQRTTMVQTALQFHFCYTALLDFLNQVN